MTHNLIYDHEGKMIADSNGNLIALPPARHWMELQKEELGPRCDIMSVVKLGDSVTFKASYTSDSVTVSTFEGPSDPISLAFGIRSKYTLVSDPEHGLEIQFTINHSPDIMPNEFRSGSAYAYFILSLVPKAGRNSDQVTSVEGWVEVPENPPYYTSSFYRLLTPDTSGLDYRSHVGIYIEGSCFSSEKQAPDGHGYTYNRPPMTCTLTIRKVKL